MLRSDLERAQAPFSELPFLDFGLCVWLPLQRFLAPPFFLWCSLGDDMPGCALCEKGTQDGFRGLLVIGAFFMLGLRGFVIVPWFWSHFTICCGFRHLPRPLCSGTTLEPGFFP